MSSSPAVPPVTRTELRACAETLGMSLSDAELDLYAAFMGGLTADFNLIAGMEAPRLPVKYPRGAAMLRARRTILITPGIGNVLSRARPAASWRASAW